MFVRPRGPRLGRAAIGGQPVEAGFEDGGQAAAPERLADDRLDLRAHGRDPFEPGAVAPQPQVGEIAAGRLQARPAALLDLQPVGDLLQVVQAVLDQAGLDEARGGRGATALGKALRQDLDLAAALLRALDSHLVLAAVEEQIEPAALRTRLAGPAERARHAVDQLDRAALGVDDPHRVAAEAVDCEERLLGTGRRELGRAQRDFRGLRGLRGLQRGGSRGWRLGDSRSPCRTERCSGENMEEESQRGRGQERAEQAVSRRAPHTSPRHL